jgi:hypothetical protein
MKKLFRGFVFVGFVFSLFSLFGCKGKLIGRLPEILSINIYEGENDPGLLETRKLSLENELSSLRFGKIEDNYPSIDIYVDNPNQDEFHYFKLFDSYYPDDVFTLNEGKIVVDFSAGLQYLDVKVINYYDETIDKEITKISVKLEGYPQFENRIIEIKEIRFLRHNSKLCSDITITLEKNVVSESHISEEIYCQAKTTIAPTTIAPYWDYSKYRIINYADLSVIFRFVDEEEQFLEIITGSSNYAEIPDDSQHNFPFDGFEVPTEFNGFPVKSVDLHASKNCLFHTLNYESLKISSEIQKIFCTFDSQDIFIFYIWDDDKRSYVPIELTAAEIFTQLFNPYEFEFLQAPEIIYNFPAD